MAINERIRFLRKNYLKIKSADEFGAKIGISGSNVRNIETGRVNATDRVISDICTVFNVNEDWLRNGGSDEDIFIELSESEEVAKYTQSLLELTDDIVADVVKEFIVIYQKLDEDSKCVLKNVAKELLGRLTPEAPGLRQQEQRPLREMSQKISPPISNSSIPFTEMSIDEKVEDYRRQLELQEKVGAESSALQKEA